MHTSPFLGPGRGAARWRLAVLAVPLAAAFAACSTPAVPPTAAPATTVASPSVSATTTPSASASTTPSATSSPAVSPSASTAPSAPSPSHAPGAPGSSIETSTSTTSTTKSTSSSSKSTTTESESSAPGRATSEGEIERIAFPNDDFDQEAFALSSSEMGNAIDPPKWRPGKPSVPVRVSDRGSKPGPETDDTVYVGCHVSLRNGPEKYPCDVLTRDVEKGDPIVITTESGTLRYTVTKTRTIPKPDFASDEETWAVVPNRLVFVMCDIVDGTATDNNYVVYAKLAD